MSDTWELRDHSQPCDHQEHWYSTTGWDCWVCPGGREITFEKYVVHDKCEYCPTLWREAST